MDMFGECSYSTDEHDNDEIEGTISEVNASIKGPSFETLTAANIITLMNEYIETVEAIVAVSFADVFFLDCIDTKKIIFILHLFSFFYQMIYLIISTIRCRRQLFAFY